MSWKRGHHKAGSYYQRRIGVSYAQWAMGATDYQPPRVDRSTPTEAKWQFPFYCAASAVAALGFILWMAKAPVPVAMPRVAPAQEQPANAFMAYGDSAVASEADASTCAAGSGSACVVINDRSAPGGPITWVKPSAEGSVGWRGTVTWNVADSTGYSSIIYNPDSNTIYKYNASTHAWSKVQQ